MGTTLGFPFTSGNLNGVSADDITGTLSNGAPPPAIVGNHFYALTVDVEPGCTHRRRQLQLWGGSRRGRTAVGGNSADLLGANVLLPEGTIAPGGMSFSGTTSNGTFINRIGSGYTKLDGFGFITAENAVSLPLP